MLISHAYCCAEIHQNNYTINFMLFHRIPYFGKLLVYMNILRKYFSRNTYIDENIILNEQACYHVCFKRNIFIQFNFEIITKLKY